MLEKTSFLQEYHLEETYQRSGIDWKILEEIYDDYTNNHYEILQRNALSLVNELENQKRELPDSEKTKVHTIFGRAKDPKHLIEKIIRKVGSENSAKKNNFKRGTLT